MHLITDKKSILGESPLWDHYNNRYYWIDIIGKKIKSLEDKTITELDTTKMPCCITLLDGNSLTLALEDEIGIYDFRDNNFHSQLKIDPSRVRFNDGKLDNNNVLHIGTMDRSEKEYIGKIYRYQNGRLEPLYNNIGISNGIAFDSKNKMYHSDSLSGNLFYDGEIINRYTGSIAPDGACVEDQTDNYYSCLWGGSAIDIYHNQKPIDKIPLPVKYPTCCCYGGINKNQMFITSASILDNSGDNGGCLLYNIK